MIKLNPEYEFVYLEWFLYSANGSAYNEIINIINMVYDLSILKVDIFSFM